ncbi:MAG: OsmC family peroxiredoxin [Actinomycetes bacterium]
MPTRTARTAWDGGLVDGGGQVELTTSGVGTFDVSWPRRSEDDAAGVTSPEELVAAAHSSCFAMQLSHEIAEAGGTPQTLEVTASVDFGQVAGGGHGVTGIKLQLRGEVEGLDADGFAKAAEAAKVGCPISRALAAVPISLEILDD